MATATIANVAPIVKELYPQSAIDSLVYKKSPLLGRVKKTTDAKGSPIRLSLAYAPTEGLSADFSVAQNRKGVSSYAAFSLTTVDEYGLFSVPTKEVRAVRDKGALVNLLKDQGDKTFAGMGERMSAALYRNHGGAKGVIESGQDTDTLTIVNKSDMVNFNKGQWIASSANDGTSGTVSTNEVQITALDRQARTITAAAAWHADFDDGDYLFGEGDFGAKLSGLESWVPSSAPSATTFFGLDRTSDATRLGGLRYAADAAFDQTIEGTLINAAADVSVEGGSPTDAFCNPRDFAQLVREIGDKTSYEWMNAKGSDGSAMPKIGYRALKLTGQDGDMTIYADRWCPFGVMWMLQLDTWELFSYGALPGWLDDDGKGQMLREGSADAMEGRIGCYWQLGCKAPGWNMRIDLTEVQQAA